MHLTKLKTYNDFYAEIEDLINENPNGAFTHNIIGMILQRCAEKLSYKDANNLIEDLGLKIYGFQKINKES